MGRGYFGFTATDHAGFVIASLIADWDFDQDLTHKKRFFKLPEIWQFHKFFGLFVKCKARVSSDNYVRALNFDRKRRKLSNLN